MAQAETGFLGLGEPRNYFIPRGYIAREDEDDWYLSIDKDQIESMNWTNAPTKSNFARIGGTASSTLRRMKAEPDSVGTRRNCRPERSSARPAR